MGRANSRSRRTPVRRGGPTPSGTRARDERRRRLRRGRAADRYRTALFVLWAAASLLSMRAHSAAIDNPVRSRPSMASLFGHLQGQEYVASEGWLLTARVASLVATGLTLLMIGVLQFRLGRWRRASST